MYPGLGKEYGAFGSIMAASRTLFTCMDIGSLKSHNKGGLKFGWIVYLHN